MNTPLEPSADDTPFGLPGNLTESQIEQFAIFINQLLNWMMSHSLRKGGTLRSIGLRAVAATWVMYPARFGDCSLNHLAMQIGFGSNNIAPLTADFSRRFKITNKFQSHNWRRSDCKHPDTCQYVNEKKQQRITVCADCGTELDREQAQASETQTL